MTEQKQNYQNEHGVTVTIAGTTKSFKIRKLGNAQLVKLCRVLMKRVDYDADDPLAAVVTDDKLSCKVAAAIVIRGFFSLRLKWWFLWRWYYYIKQYDVEQLNELLSEGIAALPYAETMNTYGMLSATREMLMNMTFTEAQKLLDAGSLLKQKDQRRQKHPKEPAEG